MKALHGTTFILTVVGGLNWGLIAIGTYMSSNWNIVNLILGPWPAVETLVYLLIGLSAASLFFTHKGDCRACVAGSSMSGMQ